MSEKQIGMELQKTVRLLDKAKETAIEQMGQAISLAADAGDIIASAELEGLNLPEILGVGGVSEEQARRFKRVAKARPSLHSPSPQSLKQLALWVGLMPDPIETSTPRPQRSWHHYLVACRQWLTRKSIQDWSSLQKADFVSEAEPIVKAFIEAGGKLPPNG
jgi:hypothetical protein